MYLGYKTIIALYWMIFLHKIINPVYFCSAMKNTIL